MRWQWQYKHFLAVEYRLVNQMMVTRDSLQMDSMMVMHLARAQVPQMDSMMVIYLACLLAYLCWMERRVSMVIHLMRVQVPQMDSMMVVYLMRVQVPHMDSMMVMHWVRVQLPQMDSMMVMRWVRRLVDLQYTSKDIVHEMSVLSMVISMWQLL
jgi:hypothetical protein